MPPLPSPRNDRPPWLPQSAAAGSPCPPAHRSNSSVPHRLVPVYPQCQADRVWGPDSEIGGLYDL